MIELFVFLYMLVATKFAYELGTSVPEEDKSTEAIALSVLWLPFLVFVVVVVLASVIKDAIRTKSAK